MEKAYNHKIYEEKIYKMWADSGIFSAKTDKSKKPFTIIMPPPNASDPLHIGHVRFVAIEDTIIRYKRMRGYSALWLPGADHAGIETQFVFEKKLRTQDKSRFDYKPDVLFKMIWDDVMKNKSTMENQMKRLGASCDWSRNKFTLDPKIIKVVYKTFKKLYDDGLIYRGERIVNYCTKCGTSFSQLEVEHKEQDDFLYFINYKTVTIATTRPETIFADSAIAVHPKDKRYKTLQGKSAILPIVNRELPIIADSLVDPEFGTGALKVTPAHDATDFEIGQKHSLPVMSVIDENGRMINTPREYIGMKILPAREKVVEDLKHLGCLVKVEPLHHSVGMCYRDKSVIEPLISKQWFIKIAPLAKVAITAISQNKVTFTNKRYEKIAKHWLSNLRDWNISRQIIWGIKIPAFRCESCLEWTITEGEKPNKCVKCNGVQFIQDSDTFDTWFSSGQWPFATLQTANPEDFDYFYPTSVMETAYDILPFWVIRMMMLGIYATGDVPFKEVLIHGLVRDKNGEKISKSKGNVIDPIEMSDKYGADALRMGILWGALVENDIALSEENIRGQRNFSNKLWNIARYIQSIVTSGVKSKSNNDDKEIRRKLKVCISKTTKLMDKYRLNEAAETIYKFVWDDFSKNYLENTKDRRVESYATLLYVLENVLKITHPLMPFVTEAIWQEFRNEFEGDMLIASTWPK